jgi:hypothetical protein
MCDVSAVFGEDRPATDSEGESPALVEPPGQSARERLPAPAPGSAAEVPAAEVPAAGRSRLAIARRSVALLLVVIAAGAFVWARQYDEFQSCQTTTTHSADVPPKIATKEECKALPPQDLLPLMLVALALLWPDLGSVELFGLGRIARRLNAQDARQNVLEAAQQRLENRVETTVSTAQNVAISFATDPSAARLVETVVNLDRRLAETPQAAETDAATAPDDGTLQAFLEAFAPIQPWVEVARRLNQPLFANALRDAAASGRPSDDPRLLETDKQLLRLIERPGQPMDLDELLVWANENALQLDAVRDTFAAGESATPESLRVATKFARMLGSDLQRRGLVPTD